MMKKYLKYIKEICDKLDRNPIGELINQLYALRKMNGRLFILGVGGSAANASHAVNDFRKLCGIQAFSFDNLSELTARINDEGWESSYKNWLEANNLEWNDMILVFSVGGGDKKRKISINLIRALDYAQKKKAIIAGIVGRDGGYIRKVADICIIIPTINKYLITPFVESFQAIIWHLLVFHPTLNVNQGKWEKISLK